MIPEEIVDKILQNADIVKVVGDYVTLRKAGVNYKGCCPFHEERTASFVVSPSKGIYKCFGCGKGGNAIGFLMEHEQMSFREAVKQLADEQHITLPEEPRTDEQNQRDKRIEEMRICLDFAADFYRSRLADKVAAAYLAKRKISDATLTRYGAGYAPEGFHALLDEAKRRGYDTETLLAAGLLTRKEDGRTFDRFVGRIVFPFRSLSGKMTGFTGRSIQEGSDCKYLNTADTELFHKGETLFGLFQARQEISRQNCCYLVEGQFDVLAMADMGVENVVCGSGTALTKEQVKLIRKFTRNVTAIYDGDAAGMKASLRNIKLMLSEGMSVRAIALPEGEDPDSYAHRLGSEKLKKFLQAKAQDVVSFVYKANAAGIEEDPIRKNEVLRLVASLVAVVPDGLQRNAYIASLAERFKADGELLKQLVSELMGEAKPAKSLPTPEPGFTGMAEAEELVKKGDEQLILTWETPRFAEAWGARPMVLVTGRPDLPAVQELRRLSPSVNCQDEMAVGEDMVEPDSVAFLRWLSRQGFTITVSRFRREFVKDKTEEEGTKEVVMETKLGFFEWYVSLYAPYAMAQESVKKVAIERCAELISYADATTRAFQITAYARRLGITKTAFEAVLKPFLDARKTESRFNNDALQVEGVSFSFDPNHLPDYVDNDPELKRLWEAHQFFPLIDKKGRKVAYIFSNGRKTFMRVGNFYIEPLLHVYDKESAANKRIVELTQAGCPYPVFMEWVSADMLTLQTFKKRLWEEGDINFSNGTQNHLDLIMDSWAGKFKKCYELRMFGYYDEGFFAFSNAIVHEVEGKQQVDYVSDLGLVEHAGQYYYIPAFSKIYASARRDSDRYYLDRFIKYREAQADRRIDFARWADLMNRVYHLNDNGKWAVIYALMCAFRSDLFNVRRTFTALFFIGPTGSGKSQLGYSIRSLSMPPDAPTFNLNSGTPAALFSWLERYRNIPVMLEEYNDTQINPVIFQALKSAVYDGEGKQKRRDAVSKELDSSQVNAALLIMGQESPQQDDNSLANRCIICEVPKRDDRTEEEETLFNTLKGHEEAGLHNVLLEILSIRKAVVTHYERYYKEAFRQLKNGVRVYVRNTDGLSRILETVSMFVAVCQLVEEQTSLKLPFTAAEFFNLAMDKVIKQVESISSTNKMFNFFNTISYLISTRQLLYGRDYKIDQPGRLTVKRKAKETEQLTLNPTDMQVLYLNMSNIFPLYQRELRSEAFSLQSINSYFDSHEAFIGRVRSTRYRWQEVREVPRGDLITGPDGEPTSDNTLKRIVVNNETNTSAVCFNYDLLADLLDVDFKPKEVATDPLPSDPDKEPSAAERAIDPLAGDTQRDFDF